MTIETTMAPDDVRDCVLATHDPMDNVTETKAEILIANSIAQGLYAAHFLISITPAGNSTGKGGFAAR